MKGKLKKRIEHIHAANKPSALQQKARASPTAAESTTARDACAIIVAVPGDWQTLSAHNIHNALEII